MEMNDHQHFYSDKSNDASTSRVQVDVDKVQVSVETKCPICQEHHNVRGLTDLFELQLKEDILILTYKSFDNDMRFPKDAFKIRYCPFCGREL